MDGSVARGVGPRGARLGAALVLVVLLMLGLLALAHGVLLSSLGELAASRAVLRHLEARTAAEAAGRLAVGVTAGPWMDSIGLWEVRPTETVPLGRAEATGALRRLAAETWLVEGVGRLPGRAEATTARLAWSLDPLARITSVEGVVNVTPGTPGTFAGSVEAGDPALVRAPLTEGDCEPWAYALEDHYANKKLAAVAVLPDTSAPGLGLLPFDSLLAGVDVAVGATGAPAPVEAFGACVEDEPWNWGDPDRAWRPCGTHLALRSSEGDLDVLGGVGQGVLIVDGNLALTGGARFYGLVLARGSLRLDGGAVFEGIALVGGDAHVGIGSAVVGSACWAVRALAAHRPTFGWLRVLDGDRPIGPW